MNVALALAVRFYVTAVPETDGVLTTAPAVRAVRVATTTERYGEQKIARFRTHDVTKELAYVSTQSQARFKGTRK